MQLFVEALLGLAELVTVVIVIKMLISLVKYIFDN
jgi:hypothetical protein